MKKLFTIALLAVALTGAAQKGKTFPDVVGATLDDKDKTIPFKNGKMTIMAVAFHRGAEDELKKWLNPLYNTFMVKSKAKNMDMSTSYDVNFVFVPMIAGIKMIADEFKASTDKAFWPVVLDTKKSDMKGAATTLGITERKTPWIFVLDKDGKIIDVQSGEYSESKIDAMEEAME